MRNAIIAAALVLFGCRPLPEDRLYLYGRAMDATGADLTDAPVALHTDCEYPGITGPSFQSQQTGAEGRFFFDVAFAEARELCLQLEGGPGGARMVASGFGELRHLYRPDQLAPVFTPSAEGLELTSARGPLTALDPETGEQRDLGAYYWDVRSDAGVVWTGRRRDAPLVLDAALREDFGPLTAQVIHQFQVSLRSPWLFADPRGEFQDQSYRAFGPLAPVPDGPATPSAIRGMPCRVGDRTFEPCPLTDGSLAFPTGPFVEAVSAAAEQRVEFLLARPTLPARIVLRDLAWVTIVAVDVSNDGLAWTPHHRWTLTQPGERVDIQWSWDGRSYAAFALSPLAEPVRFLALRVIPERYSSAPPFVAAEVSVFE